MTADGGGRAARRRPAGSARARVPSAALPAALAMARWVAVSAALTLGIAACSAPGPASTDTAGPAESAPVGEPAASPSGAPAVVTVPALTAAPGSSATVADGPSMTSRTGTGPDPADPTGASTGTASATAGGTPDRTTGTPPDTTPPSTAAPDSAVGSAAPDTAPKTTPPDSTPGTDAPSAAATTSRDRPAFRSSIVRIDDALATRMTTSYHEGCPVPLHALRYLRVSHVGFDGAAHTGELVVAADVADDIVSVFRTLYAERFPIRQMRLVDDFGGSDDESMAADNTSAFNCRQITGGGGWSEHSFGAAIDINPVENPYVSGSVVLPPAGRDFLDRPHRPGVIRAGDAVVRAFTAIGWTWGGSWSSPVDLQHFSRSGH